jgi:peptidase M24-like protein
LPGYKYRRLENQKAQGHPGIIRFRGFNREIFYGHIFGGSSAAVPSISTGPTGGPGLGALFSQGSGRKKLHPNEPILIDYVASVAGYLADQTRIFSIGIVPDKFQDAHLLILAEEILPYQTGINFWLFHQVTIGRRQHRLIIQKWPGLCTSNPAPLVTNMSKIVQAMFALSVDLLNKRIGQQYNFPGLN